MGERRFLHPGTTLEEWKPVAIFILQKKSRGPERLPKMTRATQVGSGKSESCIQDSWTLVFYKTLRFEAMSNVQKNCENGLKNSHFSLIQIRLRFNILPH